MRKLIGIILAVLMLFSMIGCTTAPSARGCPHNKQRTNRHR